VQEVLGPKLACFVNEAWFHLTVCISTQSVVTGLCYSDTDRSVPSRSEDRCVACH